jgi:hypothetical protein
VPRFSLRELFATFTLLAVGVAAAVWIVKRELFGAADISLWIAGPIWLASGAAIGAGIASPFKRGEAIVAGALIGVGVQAVPLLGYLATAEFAAKFLSGLNGV